MKLYALSFGKKKKGKMTIIMIDSKKKCEAYRTQRLNSGKHADASKGHYRLEEAEKGAKPYRKKSASTKTGWVGKNGWQPHT